LDDAQEIPLVAREARFVHERKLRPCLWERKPRTRAGARAGVDPLDQWIGG
jgi:hypothetical protein